MLTYHTFTIYIYIYSLFRFSAYYSFSFYAQCLLKPATGRQPLVSSFSSTFFLSLLIQLHLLYPHFNLDTENILFQSDAKIKSGNVEFNPTLDIFRVGRCTYSKPFHLWDSTTKARSLSNFTTNFTFMMDTNSQNYFTDGFDFFLAPFGYPIPPNSARGDLGLFNITNHFETSQNKAILVEFDSCTNEWDPEGPHVGITVNSISSVVNDRWDFNVTRSRNVTSAQVTFDASTYMLTVFWTYNEATRLRLVSQLLLEHISTWEFTSDLDSDDKSRKGKRAIFLIVAIIEVTFFILMLSVALCWRVTKIKRPENICSNAAVPSISKHLETLAFPR
ncbi:putative concanavalin A-like lectin/glucanase domain-containing protein [Rosa chinensis]|uniref:Putative concanavalin A-like lectin/glucanase domain-containing protein n=1 Tax=Rosa chinensis TaxID=74649 RepID=A0A2P6SHQ9_ROSCH|nr:putative concanavalin A-like lectin/glucanase domain-containing protein [Rosa chinensis]